MNTYKKDEYEQEQLAQEDIGAAPAGPSASAVEPEMPGAVDITKDEPETAVTPTPSTTPTASVGVQYKDGLYKPSDVQYQDDKKNELATKREEDAAAIAEAKKRMDEQYETIMSSKFEYDAMSDPLFKMYEQQYIKGGQLAMKDTMANAAFLSGGYGNSYAATAGQQTYNQYMSELSGVIPELYDAAYGRWRTERSDMVNHYEKLAADYERLSSDSEADLSRLEQELEKYDSEYDTIITQAQDAVVEDIIKQCLKDGAVFTDDDIRKILYQHEGLFDEEDVAVAMRTINEAVAEYQEGLEKEKTEADKAAKIAKGEILQHLRENPEEIDEDYVRYLVGVEYADVFGDMDQDALVSEILAEVEDDRVAAENERLEKENLELGNAQAAATIEILEHMYANPGLANPNTVRSYLDAYPEFNKMSDDEKNAVVQEIMDAYNTYMSADDEEEALARENDKYMAIYDVAYNVATMFANDPSSAPDSWIKLAIGMQPALNGLDVDALVEQVKSLLGDISQNQSTGLGGSSSGSLGGYYGGYDDYGSAAWTPSSSQQSAIESVAKSLYGSNHSTASISAALRETGLFDDSNIAGAIEAVEDLIEGLSTGGVTDEGGYGADEIQFSPSDEQKSKIDAIARSLCMGQYSTASISAALRETGLFDDSNIAGAIKAVENSIMGYQQLAAFKGAAAELANSLDDDKSSWNFETIQGLMVRNEILKDYVYSDEHVQYILNMLDPNAGKPSLSETQMGWLVEEVAGHFIETLLKDENASADYFSVKKYIEEMYSDIIEAIDIDSTIDSVWKKMDEIDELNNESENNYYTALSNLQTQYDNGKLSDSALWNAIEGNSAFDGQDTQKIYDSITKNAKKATYSYADILREKERIIDEISKLADYTGEITTAVANEISRMMKESAIMSSLDDKAYTEMIEEIKDGLSVNDGKDFTPDMITEARALYKADGEAALDQYISDHKSTRYNMTGFKEQVLSGISEKEKTEMQDEANRIAKFQTSAETLFEGLGSKQQLQIQVLLVHDWYIVDDTTNGNFLWLDPTDHNDVWGYKDDNGNEVTMTVDDIINKLMTIGVSKKKAKEWVNTNLKGNK